MTLSVSSFCQKKHGVMELNPYTRYDKYKEFFGWETPIEGKRYVKPEGLSYGLIINLKKPVYKDYNLNIGIGYHRYNFSKMSVPGRLGTSNARLINFPSPLFILFYTDKYWYNTASLNVGAEKQFKLKNKHTLTTGIALSNYYTFSQHYHLTSNPGGSQDYKKKNNQYFGLSAWIEIGLLKKINKFTIGPKLQIPVFTNWKTDETFPNETNSASRSKWLRGIGFGLSFNYSLTKKNKL